VFENVLRLVKEEFDGGRAKEFVTRVTGYHRIPASPGFRAAARYVDG